MKATDFTRDDCQLDRRRLSYERLEREYRCEDCGNHLSRRWDESYAEHWHIACVGCGGHRFIHERQARKQRGRAARVIATLPREIVQSYLANKKGD